MIDSDNEHGQREQRHGPKEKREREDFKNFAVEKNIEHQLDGT